MQSKTTGYCRMDGARKPGAVQNYFSKKKWATAAFLRKTCV